MTDQPAQRIEIKSKSSKSQIAATWAVFVALLAQIATLVVTINTIATERQGRTVDVIPRGNKFTVENRERDDIDQVQYVAYRPRRYPPFVEGVTISIGKIQPCRAVTITFTPDQRSKWILPARQSFVTYVDTDGVDRSKPVQISPGETGRLPGIAGLHQESANQDVTGIPGCSI